MKLGLSSIPKCIGSLYLLEEDHNIVLSLLATKKKISCCPIVSQIIKVFGSTVNSVLWDGRNDSYFM